MSKKNKKTAKNKISFLTKLKSMNKKTVVTVICVICGIIVIAASLITVRTIKKRQADRTVRVAFYGLSEDMINLIKEKIPVEDKVILEYDLISDGNFDSSLVKDKYDMLFTWRGEITETLSPSAEDIPSRILESIPSSMRDKKCPPLFLDHCEISFNTEVLNKVNMDTDLSFDAYCDFLNKAKDYVFSPFFCNGAEDRILIDYIGALVMAKSGLSAYNNLIKELRNSDDFDALLDVKLDNKDCSLRSLLDMLKSWPSQGLTHPSWYNGRGNDLLYFAEDKQLACFFTLLSDHRKMAYGVVKNYETSLVPSNAGPENYGLIAPSVGVMLLSDNSNCKRYVANFFTEEAQEEFSDRTGLAPVHSRSQAHDRQADDVRFWAASCKGGAMPDLYLAVYQRKSKELEKICSEIRSYVR